MTTEIDRRLVGWLEDAYAMEQEAETMLKAMASRIKHYPAFQQRIEQHVSETQQQMQNLEQCLQELDASKPTAKAAIGSAMATVHAMGNAMMDDEVAKGVGIAYAFEQMEVASYRALIIAARRAERPRIAAICEQILGEEQAMVDWLFEQQPALIDQFLNREWADLEAKR